MNLLNSDRVEKYLLNKMTESEKAAFQFELMQDRDLQQEVRTMRIVQKTLIAEKRGVKVPQKDSPSFWKWLLPLLLLPILFFFWNKKDVEIVPPSTPKTEVSPPITPEKKEEVKETEPAKEESPIDEEIKKYAPKDQNEAIKKEIENKPQYIAMAEPADLVPNPLFEQMSSGTRGNDLDLVLNSPSSFSIISWQESAFILPFTGTITSDEEPNLQLLIFSNKKADYENWEYLKQENLKIIKSDEGFSFSVRPTLQLKRGLYYYLIENMDTETPVTIGKFEVR